MISFFLMRSQMMRVISSPSSSTTGLATFTCSCGKPPHFGLDLACFSRRKRGQTGRRGGQTAPTVVALCALRRRGQFANVRWSVRSSAKHIDVAEAVADGPVLLTKFHWISVIKFGLPVKFAWLHLEHWRECPNALGPVRVHQRGIEMVWMCAIDM